MTLTATSEFTSSFVPSKKEKEDFKITVIIGNRVIRTDSRRFLFRVISSNADLYTHCVVSLSDRDSKKNLLKSFSIVETCRLAWKLDTRRNIQVSFILLRDSGFESHNTLTYTKESLFSFVYKKKIQMYNTPA